MEPTTPAATTAATDPQGAPRDLVIVANRLPVKRGSGAGSRWERSPGGLVSALEPAVVSHRTAWVGWSGSSRVTPAAFTH